MTAFSPLQVRVDAALAVGPPASESAAAALADRLRALLRALPYLGELDVQVTDDPRLKVVVRARASGPRPVEIGLDLTELALGRVEHHVVWTDGPQCAGDFLLDADGVLTARVQVLL